MGKVKGAEKMSKSELRNHCYAMGYSDGEVSAFYDGIEKGRADAFDEVIRLARTEIDFESQAEQKRFVEFMEQLKEQK